MKAPCDCPAPGCAVGAAHEQGESEAQTGRLHPATAMRSVQLMHDSFEEEVNFQEVGCGPCARLLLSYASAGNAAADL